MLIRLTVALWVLYALIWQSLPHALATVFVLAFFQATIEIVFASLLSFARIQARREEEEQRRAEIERAIQAAKEAAPNYFKEL